MDLRPRFHLARKDQWINDPCGLIHLDGHWHAYTQTNPTGVDWGNMSWGHATSADLVHWDDQGIAIECTAELDIFTGSTLVDTENLTGFGTAEHPPLLAYWTGHHRPASPDAPGEDQRLAVSLDAGSTFTVPSGINPVLTRDSADFRDPKVLRWSDGSDEWFVMASVEALDRQVLFYTSTNLLDWQLASTFGPLPTPTGIWECPDLVRLPGPDTGGEVWMLSISAFGDDVELPATHHWLGTFDGHRFTPHDPAPRRFDHGPDLYATTTFARTPPGAGGDRQVAMGWLSNPSYAAATPLLGVDGSGGRGCLSLPRELGAARDGAGWRLTQRVPDEVRDCLGAERIVAADVASSNPRAALEPTDLEPTDLEPTDLDLVEASGLVTVTFQDATGRLDWDGIAVIRDRSTLRLERGVDPALGERFPVTTTLPLADASDPVTLEVWADRTSVEVFTAAGEVWSATWYPRQLNPWRAHGRVEVRYRPIG